MYLAIQQKMRIDMGTLLDNVAVSWSEVPYSVRQTVLTSALATFPVLYRFPNNWVAEMLMVKVCRNKRDTVANKKSRLRGQAEDQKTSVPAAGIEESKDEDEDKDEGGDQPQGGLDDEVADKAEGESLVDESIHPPEDTEEQLDDHPAEDRASDPTSGDEFEDNEMETAEADLDDLDGPERQSQGDEHVTIDESEAQVDDLMFSQDEVETNKQVGAQAPSTLHASSPIPLTICTSSPSLPIVQPTPPRSGSAPSQGKDKTKAPKAATKSKPTASSIAVSTPPNSSTSHRVSSSTLSSKTPSAPPTAPAAPTNATPASKSAKTPSRPTIPRKPADKAPTTSKKTTDASSKAASSNSRAPANKAPAASSDSVTSGAQVSTASQKTTSKRKAQPDLESEPAHVPEQPAVEPPAKKQKANTQVKRKSKATNRSNSWARKCQEEVAQLESANTNAKKKSVKTAGPATSAGPSNAIPGASSSTPASTLGVSSTDQVKPPRRPRARPPPKDAPAEMTLAIKQEMVDLFDMKSASVPRRETRSTTKK
ncbi:hypothetical protein RSOLAG1IB_12520 [Rhizoctonia solani AG-1 IB]|uniref:Uncharacterized protein n=1 Tax=Thanatephorus cucumeris (strain AG1-IB / isolate 7/3/14) TaxID=1108050 RepID=A0A0B7FZA8_THACB|nr:hypothetical protein RSOLAG1IB_12520 [Rhizoctonia solani AG-1 IB]